MTFYNAKRIEYTVLLIDLGNPELFSWFVNMAFFPWNVKWHDFFSRESWCAQRSRDVIGTLIISKNAELTVWFTVNRVFVLIFNIFLEPSQTFCKTKTGPLRHLVNRFISGKTEMLNGRFIQFLWNVWSKTFFASLLCNIVMSIETYSSG